MRLDIIIPHYREPWETCKYMFDSIAMQRGVPFDQIKVILVNDGEDVVFPDDLLSGYPYQIEYHVKPHGGISATRNFGLDVSDADYVMFCDCDDGFLSNYGLHLVFGAMQEGFDFLISKFIEESYDDVGQPMIVPHEMDITFMHGKVYRRAFLKEKNIRFDPKMMLHEDGYFNALVYIISKHEGKQKEIKTPFYLWCWNQNSTVRKDKEDFVLKTYEEVMQTRIGICSELLNRGYNEEAETSICLTVLNSYYDFQKPSYHLDKNSKYLRKAERAFKGYYLLFRHYFFQCTNLKIAGIAQAARANACQNGFLFEQQDLKSWLRHIENDVK